MPLQLLHNTISPAANSEQDVQSAFVAGLSLSPAALGRARYDKVVYDLGDYFFYVGAVCPDYFRLLQPEIVNATDTQLANFQWTFATWLYLLQGAPDACVSDLARRLTATDLTPFIRSTLEQMLAGMCTTPALAVLADYARSMDSVAKFEELGFSIPDSRGPAVPRFMLRRFAAQAVYSEDGNPTAFSNPIGLPISAIMADGAQDVVTWHYCSLDLMNISEAPTFPASRIHLISPPHDDQWTVYCASLSDSRYTRATLHGVVGADAEIEQMLRDRATNEQHIGKGHLVLIPYDDRLVYCNSHVELTPGVVGDVGGPPIGLYPNPHCIACDTPMLHVSTMTSYVRGYGSGFRSLYICEACGLVASHAMPWN